VDEFLSAAYTLVLEDVTEELGC